jgi:hypothetical protein
MEPERGAEHGTERGAEHGPERGAEHPNFRVEMLFLARRASA